jgi:phage terminase Nu1 subunit (DNA packaging protein)
VPPHSAIAIWWIRNKLKEEDEGNKEVEYEMKKKAEVTEESIRQ